MEQVIREYGQFLLSAITVILVISLFVGMKDNAGNTGIFKVVGSQIEIIDIDYKKYTDFRNIYQIESGKDEPIIRYVSGHLKTGIVKLGEHIKATDYANRNLKLRITEIIGPDGENLLEQYDESTTELGMYHSGVYTVKVNALDDCNRLSECVIKIPVIR